MLVREQPDRPLQHRAAENRDAHQQADTGGIETDLARIYRCQTPETAQRKPGNTGRHQRQRGDARQLQQVGGWLVRQRGLRLAGQGDRHQRATDEDGGQREQREIHRCVEAQQLLGSRQRAEVDRHVQREHLAALLAADLRVQPAFDDHVQRDQRHPVEHPQHQPHPRVDDQHVHQYGDRRQSGIESEGADMADAADQRGRQPGADQEAREIAGHQQTDHAGGVAFGNAAQGQECVEQPVAEQQQSYSAQQRTDGGNQGLHVEQP